MKYNFNFNIMDLIVFYFKKIFSNTVIIILVFLIGLNYINNFYETKYVAKTTFMIGACFHDCEQESHLNIDFNKKILFDYMQLIKSDRLLEKVNKLANLKYSTSELRSMVKVSYEEDTEYVIISVESTNEIDSAVIAYELYDVLGDEIERVFDVNNIHMIDSNSLGREKISKKMLIIYDLLIAIIISIIKCIIEFIFFFKGPISNKKTPENLNKYVEQKDMK